MKFSELAGYFEQIESVSSRITITTILAGLFGKLSSEELEKTAYLLQGRICPAYEHIEFGMAEKTVIRSSLSALHIDKDLFQSELRKQGDVGKTVEYFKKQMISFEEKDLTILEVFNDLYRLATAEGNGSQETKIQILSFLIRQLDPLSTRYLVRIPQAVMRLGFSDMTVLDAYSWMMTGDKSLRPGIERAFHVRPDLGYIGSVLKKDGMDGINKIEPKLFTPIIMMRAERLSSGQEIIEQIGTCAIEPKYDGFRLQVHISGATVKLFSRGLEDVSYMYPDIVNGVQKEIQVHDAILEGEAIGFDPQQGTFLPFQETVQRKRKYNISEKALEIPLKLFIFELLFKDGINYIHKPFTTRRSVLEETVNTSGKATEKTVILAPHSIMDNPKLIEDRFTDAIGQGLEGIIAKKLDGVYQPGARAWNWIKFKRSYSSKINDTIDCLVMGYDMGKGKRTDFGIGAFLVGVYDAKTEQYVTIAKIGTGLTDAEWRELQQKCEQVRVGMQPQSYIVDKQMACDVWVGPSIVVEIRADEITHSPVHTAKLALRFPRLERFRDDKTVEEITSLSEITAMVKKQEKK